MYNVCYIEKFYAASTEYGSTNVLIKNMESVKQRLLKNDACGFF